MEFCHHIDKLNTLTGPGFPSCTKDQTKMCIHVSTEGASSKWSISCCIDIIEYVSIPAKLQSSLAQININLVLYLFRHCNGSTTLADILS